MSGEMSSSKLQTNKGTSQSSVIRSHIAAESMSSSSKLSTVQSVIRLAIHSCTVEQ